jgi:hypothetical protein
MTEEQQFEKLEKELRYIKRRIGWLWAGVCFLMALLSLSWVLVARILSCVII